MLEGLADYAKWQRATSHTALLRDAGGPWDTYVVAIDQLLASLHGGCAARVGEEKSRRREAKTIEDLTRLMCMLDRCAMRRGIRRAQLTLLHLERATRGLSSLDENAQAEANACTVGIILCDGYVGRSQSWYIMIALTVLTAHAEGNGWLICDTHTTSRTYGCLAKLLALGVREALKCYLRMPRRADVDLLVVPPRVGTEHASVSKALCLSLVSIYQTVAPSRQ